MSKKTKWLALLVTALMVLLIGCPMTSDSNGTLDPTDGTTDPTDGTTDPTDSVALPDTMDDGQKLATDRSVDFITEIESQVVNAQSLNSGDTVTIDGVAGDIDITTPASAGTVQSREIGEKTLVKTINVDFPDDKEKISGTTDISVYDDETWEMDGEVTFEVTDEADADKKIPIKYEKTEFGKEGKINSGAIKIKDTDGKEVAKIDTKTLGTLKKLAMVVRKIDSALASVTADDYETQLIADGIKQTQTLKVGEDEFTYPLDTQASQEEYGAKVLELVQGGGDWVSSSYQEYRMRVPEGQEADYGGIQLDITNTSTLDMTWKGSSLGGMEMSSPVGMEMSSTIEGSAEAEGIKVEFKPLKISFKADLSDLSANEDQFTKQMALTRFAGSIFVDGVELKMSSAAFKKLSKLFTASTKATQPPPPGGTETEPIDEEGPPLE